MAKTEGGWNYRIVRYKSGEGFGLHEVYYDGSGQPWGMTYAAPGFVADAEEGSEGVLAMLDQAFSDARKHSVLEEPEVWPGVAPSVS